MCLRNLTVFVLLTAAVACSQTKPAASADEPLASVGGVSIYEKDLLPFAAAQMQQLHNQEYQIRRTALDSAIEQRLLEAEAKKKGVTPEKLVEDALGAKAADPTDPEVEAFYLAQRDRINRPLEQVKPQVRQALKQARTQAARQEFMEKLRAASQVEVYLRPPRTEVAVDRNRLRGDPKAPVTIVEFSDFQCPFCARVQPTLQAVLEKYKGKVNISFRDFPLNSIHAQAAKAAEGGRCAGEQGKFWEFHDRIFADNSKLDPASLVTHAKAAGLDDKTFETCLSSGKFRAPVEQDTSDGARAGVNGTPGFFINGVALSGAQPVSEFEKVIDTELALVARPAAAR
jgi:protein-disulfide isomerase